jgi:hypothetical protein
MNKNSKKKEIDWAELTVAVEKARQRKKKE